MRPPQMVWLVLMALTLWAATPTQALAHPGLPRLTLNTYQARPGAVIEIVGINLAPGQPITISLASPQAELTLGTVMGNEHGDFTQSLQLASEILEGTYHIVASVQGINLASSDPLTVSGPPLPLTEEGENGPVDEEDGLLVAIPTATQFPLGQYTPPPPVPTRPVPTQRSFIIATALPNPPPTAVTSSWPLMVVSALVSALVLGGLFIAWRLRRP